MPTDLDHVALATRDAGPAIRTLTGDLSGTILFGGQGVGFRPMQILLGDSDDGMRIELLEPWLVEENDFLDRFLARHGEGPHHLTFKVEHLDDALERVRAAGFTPVNIDRSDPEWQEAFLLPREAHGTVLQLAETDRSFPTRAALLAHVERHGPDAHPQWWPDPPSADPRDTAFLDRVVLRTHDLDAALGLFAGLLEGTVHNEANGGADVTWPGGATIRLRSRPDEAVGIGWLEGRVDGPQRELGVAGARLHLESM